MDILSALTLPFAVLLIIAGVDKLRSPDGARQALRLVGAPDNPLLVRVLPTAEIVAGAAYLAWGGRVFAGAALLLYLAFVAVVTRSLLTSASNSCGCFGVDSSALSVTHLVVDLAAVTAFAVAYLSPSAGPLTGDTPLGWGMLAIAVAIATGLLLRALLVELPAVVSLARTTEVRS